MSVCQILRTVNAFFPNDICDIIIDFVLLDLIEQDLFFVRIYSSYNATTLNHVFLVHKYEAALDLVATRILSHCKVCAGTTCATCYICAPLMAACEVREEFDELLHHVCGNCVFCQQPRHEKWTCNYCEEYYIEIEDGRSDLNNAGIATLAMSCSRTHNTNYDID